MLMRSPATTPAATMASAAESSRPKWSRMSGRRTANPDRSSSSTAFSPNRTNSGKADSPSVTAPGRHSSIHRRIAPSTLVVLARRGSARGGRSGAAATQQVDDLDAGPVRALSLGLEGDVPSVVEIEIDSERQLALGDDGLRDLAVGRLCQRITRRLAHHRRLRDREALRADTEPRELRNRDVARLLARTGRDGRADRATDARADLSRGSTGSSDRARSLNLLVEVLAHAVRVLRVPRHGVRVGRSVTWGLMTSTSIRLEVVSNAESCSMRSCSARRRST